MNQAAPTADRLDQGLCVLALTLSIELVLFKFAPDISAQILQNAPSPLGSYAAFEHYYLQPGSVHYARFLGNYILYFLAKLVEPAYHGGDLRLHPLRIAAGLLTPLYALIGAGPVLINALEYSWHRFFALYAFAVLISLYVFYPCDMPAFAFLSIALLCVLRERMWAALLFMLIVGLFRESSFHVIGFAAAWSMSGGRFSPVRRLAWVAGFASAFLIEYLAIRHFFPGPVSAVGHIILDWKVVFLDKGLLSLTSVCSLGLATLFPIACLLKVQAMPRGDWRGRFFIIHCAAFPAWVVFYRMLNGNTAELRMLLPAILPCIYGIAYQAASNRPLPRLPSIQSGSGQL
jgi:hypothetical protein